MMDSVRDESYENAHFFPSEIEYPTCNIVFPIIVSDEFGRGGAGMKNSNLLCLMGVVRAIGILEEMTSSHIVH